MDLAVEGVSYAYRDGDTYRSILKDVSLTFESGKFYAILGESGSGKTTFLSIISALDEPGQGRVLFDGKDLQEIGLDTFRRNYSSIVFQSYNLIPYMNAVENVMVIMGISDRTDRASIKKQALYWLETVGIDQSKAYRKVTKLSGGEQQRVAIARALSTEAKVIFADEPTGNLDSTTSETIISLLKKLATDHDKCVITVTHSEAVAQQADVVLHLDSKLQQFNVTGGQ